MDPYELTPNPDGGPVPIKRYTIPRPAEGYFSIQVCHPKTQEDLDEQEDLVAIVLGKKGNQTLCKQKR